QELLHVNPPKLEDYSSSEESGSDDDDARPLTREELKGRTLNKMQRKNAREGGGRGKGKRPQRTSQTVASSSTVSPARR
ncbi:unnamed protein product, partial [Sphacelaria rigidula]